MTTRQHKLPYNPQLGRNVNHDDRSKNFPAEKGAVKTILHEREIPILNQMNLGKCTAEAMVGLLGCTPFFEKLSEELQTQLKMPGDSTGEADNFSDELYHVETELQDPNDAYPPNDPGGSGLYVMKAAKSEGLINHYQHAFGLEHALRAIANRPVIIGVTWYNSMFETDNNGFIRVDPNSGVAGGHEILVRGSTIANADELDAAGNYISGDNSWGEGWGIDLGLGGGSWHMHTSDFNLLLQDYGDVTTATPLHI